MAVQKPFNLKAWIDNNRHLLKPPVCNQCVYKDAENFIVMVVGGPNARKDFHYNESEELYLQIEGNMVLRINEGDMFLLPPKTPHSPQRPENTIGLVIEKVRENKEIDGFLWFCENCNEKLYEEYFELTDIVKQLPPVMEKFYSSETNRVCNHCGTVMQAPVKK